ncbi:MAG: hypothetical protein WCF23_18705 [Candidatus Nitrosopolaris sp.]
MEICNITTREHHTKEKENTSLTGLDFRTRRRSCALVKLSAAADGSSPRLYQVARY